MHTDRPDRKAPSGDDRGAVDAVLAGACELALLEEGWEYFIHHPRFDFLYVVDAPAIASVHALPPHNIAHFGITGFLDTPSSPRNLRATNFIERQNHFRDNARQFPLALSLTEIIARYLYTSRWSGGAPKLMLGSQVAAIGNKLDQVETQCIEELKLTQRSVVQADPIQRLREQLGGQTLPAELLDKVSENLEQLLPGIYGPYTASRQLLRYMQVLPFKDVGQEHCRFAESYAELREALDAPVVEIAGHLASSAEVQNAWLQAIPPRPGRIEVERRHPGHGMDFDGSGSTLRDNAITLSEVERVNRAMAAAGRKTRLVFVTTTGRLFSGALNRFNVPHPGGGTPDPRFSHRDSYNKFRYLSSLLSGRHPELDIAPVFDPRILMTSPDFVRFANHESAMAGDDTLRAISTWIPPFFDSLVLDTGHLEADRLLRLYTGLQDRGHANLLNDFPEAGYYRKKDVTLLTKEWDGYIRLVASAEGVERLLQRQIFSDLRSVLSQTDDGLQAMQALVSKRLDDSMSQWLDSVSARTISLLMKDREHGGAAPHNPAARFEEVPPLMLPSLSAGVVSFEEIRRAVPSADQRGISFDWLTNPAFKHASLHADDPLRELKTRYLRILGQGLLFGTLGNWDSAYRLSSQAYAMAESFLASDDRGSNTFVSGREAAYLASVSKRRHQASQPVQGKADKEMEDWPKRYLLAVQQELPVLRQGALRHQIHMARHQSELLQWDIHHYLLTLYFDGQDRPRRWAGPGVAQVDVSAMVRAAVKLLQSELDLIVARHTRDQYPDDVTFDSYGVVVAYLPRAVAAAALQVLLLAPAGEAAAAEWRADLRTLLAALWPQPGVAGRVQAPAVQGTGVIWWDALAAAARMRLGEAGPRDAGVAAALPTATEGLPRFDQWRLERLAQPLAAN